MSVRIDPSTFYTRADLQALLGPIGINADHFVAKIQPTKRFRMAWWGWDLIAAIDKAEPIRWDEVGSSAAERMAEEIMDPVWPAGPKGSRHKRRLP